MKISILKEQFVKELNKISPALKKAYDNEELNINDKIVFDFQSDGSFNIYARNEETSIKVKLYVKWEGEKEEKRFLIDGKKIINLVSKLENKEFVMCYSDEDQTLGFEQDCDIYLPTKPADTFESLDDHFNKAKLVATYPLARFNEIFNFSKVFGIEDGGFGFVQLKDKQIVTGSNEWIGYCKDEMFGGAFEIPVNVISGFLKYLSLMEGENIHLYENDNWYFIKDESETYMAIKKMESNMPNFTEVMEGLEVLDTISIERHRFMNAIDRLSVPLEKSFRMSFALLGEDILQISSKNISEKICKESIGVVRKQKEDIIFNVNYARVFKILNYFSESMVYIDVFQDMIAIYDNSEIKSFIVFMQDR